MNERFLKHILFLDMETVPEFPSYDQLDEASRQNWDKKAMQLSYGKPDFEPENLYNRAGIYAEFGKIICISFGFMVKVSGKWECRIKSFTDKDEKALLQRILNLFDKEYGFTHLCAHNGKEFDFPYLCRRLIIHGLPLPEQLNIGGLKPWEIKHFDTLELWKFGDYKHYVSLDLLAHLFHIPTPKSLMDGSMVKDVYYIENDLNKIALYCNQDVYALIQVFLRMKQISLAEPIELVYL